MSPHTQIVANKFLLKPKISQLSSQPSDENWFEIDTPLDQTNSLPWNPISLEDALDLLQTVHHSKDAPDNDHETEDTIDESSPLPNSEVSFEAEISINDKLLDRTHSSGPDPRNQPLPDSDQTNSGNISSGTYDSISSDSSHEICTFNDGEGIDLPERLCQVKRPEVGDSIAFYDEREKGIQITEPMACI